jgi:hypothetical protein
VSFEPGDQVWTKATARSRSFRATVVSTRFGDYIVEVAIPDLLGPDGTVLKFAEKLVPVSAVELLAEMAKERVQ